MSEQMRCPSCGALTSPSAHWCGQCFAVLRPARATTVPTSGTLERAATGGDLVRGGLEVEGGRPTWTRPACEAHNQIEASACEVCGTPFARLFQLSVLIASFITLPSARR